MDILRRVADVVYQWCWLKVDTAMGSAVAVISSLVMKPKS
jgi:hypothetical protein|tara:strand:+ start:431 stop:550 length:120 start_codon:yes stop_codon:yes gene_type:complete